MDLTSEAAAGHRRAPPRTITRLLAAGALDADLAGLVWVLAEGGVPLVVAGEPLAAAATAEGVMGMVTPSRGMDAGRPGLMPIDELARTEHGPDLARGRLLAAIITAGSLDELYRVLAAPPAALGEDEIRRLGVVLVQRAVEPGDRLRVVAAHYLRPVERDGHGHLQRRPPAVLATWDPRSDTFEHFAWGVTPELAFRVGRTQSDLERLQARRSAFLHGLMHAGVTEPAELRLAMDRYRLEEQLERTAATNGTRHLAHDHQHGGREPRA